MRKKLFILTVVSLMVCLIGFVGFASACGHDRHKECNSKLERGRLCLFQKTPVVTDYYTGNPCNVTDCGGYKCLVYYDNNQPYLCLPSLPLGDQNWEIDGDGAWGKLKYNPEGKIFDFEFEGHGLEPKKSYTLIYYPENEYYGGLIYFGSDIADKSGHVHINGSLDTGSLPVLHDSNYPAGAKIWLVPSTDVCFRTLLAPHIVNWILSEYLFEEKLITFHDTDPWHCD